MQNRGAWRLPLACPEAGSPVTKNEVNLRQVLPAIAGGGGAVDVRASHGTGSLRPPRRPPHGGPQGRGRASQVAQSVRPTRFLGDDEQAIMAEIEMLESDLHLAGGGGGRGGQHRRGRTPPQPPPVLPNVGGNMRGRGAGQSRRPPEMLGGETGVPIYAVRPPMPVAPAHKAARHKPQWHVRKQCTRE